ncbi:hypothetical protein CTAYLR_004523 [Chrysophaeum taylorii]|uniref:Glucose/Sorbosone dehydrogenase domain-containing protein n=1 Tax=Chrysophaeum taylorii TaxID=2483200 RepID=A0AAD7UMV1_9STRA|nr:hypothetical protein CTAYLR_004523 [Chrysophaeum taylorii]
MTLVLAAEEECVDLTLNASNSEHTIFLVEAGTGTVIYDVDGTEFHSVYLEDIGFAPETGVTIVAHPGPDGWTDLEYATMRLRRPSYQDLDPTNWPDEKVAAVPIPEVEVGTFTATIDDGWAMFGATCAGGYEAGLEVGFPHGVYQVIATFSYATGETVEMTSNFRIHKSSDGNPLPEDQRPQKADGYVLELAPYADMPEVYWDADETGRIHGSENDKSDRVNTIIPWEGYVYIVMELTAVVYKVDGSWTYLEKSEYLATNAFAPWFDVYAGVEEATAIEENGPARVIDFISTQHSGLRSLAFHPSYNASSGYVYTAHLERRPDTVTTYDDDLGEGRFYRKCSRPEGWTWTGDFFAGRDWDSDEACGDAVVVEWLVENDVVVYSSYRLLVRFNYAQTGEQSREYEHPVKQIGFQPGTTFLYIENGDGSVDSSVAFGGQNPAGPYGCIMRVDVAGTEGTSHHNYVIPPGNYADATGRDEFAPEVCAIGFRNPHGLGFVTDPNSEFFGTVIMFDGGRDNAEEVNHVICGENYGWSNREGLWVQFDDIGGLSDGIYPRPEDDADFNYKYPVAMFAHDGLPNEGFGGQCGVGNGICENEGADLYHHYCFSDFPVTGYVYCSLFEDMMAAQTKGDNITIAPVRWMYLKYYATLDLYAAQTPTLETYEFREIAQIRRGTTLERSDARIARGIYGEILFSSKRDGRIYQALNSLHPTDLEDMLGEVVVAATTDDEGDDAA